MFAFLYDTNNEITIQFSFIEFDHVKFKNMKEKKEIQVLAKPKNIYITPKCHHSLTERIKRKILKHFAFNTDAHNLDNTR